MNIDANKMWFLFILGAGLLIGLIPILIILFGGIDWFYLTQLQFWPLLVIYVIIGYFLFWFGLTLLSAAPWIDDKKVASVSTYIISIFKAIILIMLLYGLFRGLVPDDVFVIGTTYVILLIISGTANLAIPRRREKMIRDQSKTARKKVLKLINQADNNLKKKDFKNFYMDLTRALEQTFRNIDASRYRFSFTTQLLMWRTWFDDTLANNLETAKRFFSAKKLGINKQKLKRLWNSTDDLRKARNIAAHKDKLGKLRTSPESIFDDVRLLITSIENWRSKNIR
ncbi:MAG: hypothetical protein K9W43_09665 [Candidatus Thorarchaeota archaeon]|nr:hypothetical protein [Candidatus Thorarchaeota archaeon]